MNNQQLNHEELNLVKRALEQYILTSPDHQSNRETAKKLWIKICRW